MSHNFQGINTRNNSKDKFEDSRRKNINSFLETINKDQNSYFQRPNNQYIVTNNKNDQQNYEYFSSIQNNVENSFNQDKNTEILNIDKSLSKFSPLDQKNFNKIVNNDYDKFENFNYPQSSSTYIKGDIKLDSLKSDNQIDSKTIIDNNKSDSKSLHNNISDNSILLQDTKGIYIPNTPVNINQTQSYMAEIGEKRRLSNIIYNSLLKTYNSISSENISEFQIQELLEKENIESNSDKVKISNFVFNLKKTIIDNSNNSIKKNTGIISDDSLFEKETKDTTFYLFIDTKDRDQQKWPSIGSFGFFFGGQKVLSWNKNSKDPEDSELINTKLGYIERDFSNVQYAELIEVIIPRLTENGDNYQLYPYLLLDIEEFGNIYEGTNQYSSSAFGKISFDKTIGNYAYYNSPENNHLIKKFNPRISLNKITIRIRKPNGELFIFGKYLLNPETNEPILISNNSELLSQTDIVDTSDDQKTKMEANLSISFKIICIQKSLETMFLNKKNN